MTSQVFAISGGPTYGGGGISPVGTYSGLIQVNQEFNNTTVANQPAGPVALPNAIGLFSLGVPTTSVAQGAALMFVEGVVFTGTISASVDPDTDQLSGIINTTYQYTLSIPNGDGTTTSESITAQANGQVTAKIAGTRQGSQSSASITGSSTIQVANGGVSTANGFGFTVNRTLSCKITGFRQSTTFTAVTALTTT